MLSSFPVLPEFGSSVDVTDPSLSYLLTPLLPHLPTQTSFIPILSEQLFSENACFALSLVCDSITSAKRALLLVQLRNSGPYVASGLPDLTLADWQSFWKSVVEDQQRLFLAAGLFFDKTLPVRSFHFPPPSVAHAHPVNPYPHQDDKNFAEFISTTVLPEKTGSELDTTTRMAILGAVHLSLPRRHYADPVNSLLGRTLAYIETALTSGAHQEILSACQDVMLLGQETDLADAKVCFVRTNLTPAPC